MWGLLLNAFVSYIEKHPAVIDQLVEEAVSALVAQLKASHTA